MTASPVRIGDATLYLGDCMEILPTLPKVDAVITDPPYGISDAPLPPGRSGAALNTWHMKSWWDKGLNPDWSAVAECAPVVIWFGQWRKRDEVSAFMPMPLRTEIVWAKDCHTGPPSPVAPRDERIWVFGRNGIKAATFETSVWDCPVIPTWERKSHKNEKPIGIMVRLVKWIGAGFVLDPFMGSGTTGVACAQLGRKFIGIEIEQENFDIACRRIEDAYRQQPLIPHEAPKAEQQELL
jgi:site-specific DNA-methyltransferase (adenine-specific)